MSDAIPNFDDDDVTGQIATAMSRPISNPEIEIRKAEVRDIMLAKRVRAIEGPIRSLRTVVLGSALAIITTVATAAYAYGAEQARDRERIEELIRRLDRLDGRAEAQTRSER
jgi:hypothetical protein